MLKLLRNLVLAAILLAGAVKLLAWYSVGNDAERIVQALAPYAQIKYDGLSAGLDGSVTVNRLNVVRIADHGTYRADSVTFETPGLFWLLRHSLLHENELPPSLRVAAQHLQMPPVPGIDPTLFDQNTLEPFAAAGCDRATFSSADYRGMGLADAILNARIDYRFQPETHSADFTVQATTPGFASASLRGDLRPLDAETILSAATWRKLHAGQLAVDFSDDGFLRRRNTYCAQKTNTTADQFVARHLDAVQALLAEHHVEPSNEVFALYKNLVTRGGAVSALSLPRTTFALADWRNGPPDDTLRQLNITARYRDTPPVMLRLTFTQPAPGEEPPAVVATAPDPAPMVVTAKPPPPTPVAVAPVPTISEPPKLAPATPPKKASDNMGLHDLDRVEAKLAPKPVPAPVKPATAPEPSKPVTEDTIIASEPPPPPGSTLALAWKPTIERLQPKSSRTEYGSLAGLIGQRVRLITDGEKRIDGYLVSADGNGVRLRIGRADGDAQFDVPKKRIQQIQLVRRPVG